MISDEIWADVTFTGHQHIPTQMVNEWAKQHTIGVYAPSKTFRIVSLSLSSSTMWTASPLPSPRLLADCTNYCEHKGITLDQLLKAGWDVGVGWQDGRFFGGPCHIRLNVASPFSRMKEACDRLDKYVFNT